MEYLAKLQVMLKQNESYVNNMNEFWKPFEVVAAIHVSETFNIGVFLWSDRPPAMRDKLGLPKQDTGIDFITEDLRIMGQAKYYTTGQIGSGDMSRTRLCAYIALENRNNTKLVLIASTDVKISAVTNKRDHFEQVTINNDDELNKFYEPSAELAEAQKLLKQAGINNVQCVMSDPKLSYTQHILTQERINDIINRAKSMIIPVSINQSVVTMPLRQCQSDAIAAIKTEGITRLNMACGSGKTKMIMDYLITRENKWSHLVLVPSVLLLEQWIELVKEYVAVYPDLNINLIPVGTGHNQHLEDCLANTGFYIDIYVCVYNSFERIGTRKFDTVVVDEAHHIDKKSFETETYLSKIAGIKNAIYLSASFPKREINYKYSVRQAITDGILTDYDIIVPYSSDVDMNVDNMLIKYFLQRPEFLSILVYFNRISEADAFVKKCELSNIKALSLSCDETMTQRTEILDRFRSGEIRVIASVNTLGEGIDIKNADVCCFARTRESEFSIIQCIGRILRKHPTKKIAHVILPVDANNLEDILIINFLAKIAKFDDVYYRDFVQKKSNRISVVNMNEIKVDIESKVETDNIEELVLNKTCSMVSDTWMVKCTILKEYYINHSDTFPKQKTNYNGIKIGSWLFHQKSNIAKLDVEKIKMLDDIDSKWKNTLIDVWKDNYALLKEYYNSHSNTFPEARTSYNGIVIGKWLHRQKSNMDNLDVEKIKMLDDIDPKWKNTLADIWKEWCVTLKEYYLNHSNTFPERRTSYNGVKIGPWLSSQKNNIDKLDVEKIKMLDDIDPKWKTKFIDIWKDNCAVLKKYYDSHSNTFPCSETSYDGIKIGTWLFHQKSNIAELDVEKIKLLNDINPKWKNTTMDNWKDKCIILKEYYNSHSNTFPIATTIYNGVKIGSWMSDQKNKIAKLDVEKIKMLDDIDPKWKNTLIDVWKDNCALLKEYYSSHSNTLPGKITSYNGTKIGSWLFTQKKNINKLDVEKIKLLDAIDPKWKNVRTRIIKQSVDKIKSDVDRLWTKNAELLSNYCEINKHLPTIVGDPDLFQWIEDNKKLYLEDKLSEEQIVALNLIDVRILPDIDPHIFSK